MVSGVPQGSVLVPALFVTFINYMLKVVEKLLKIFANDKKDFASITSEQDQKRLHKNYRFSLMNVQLRFDATC